jgi:serine/threonine protein phosphatase PrpC
MSLCQFQAVPNVRHSKIHTLKLPWNQISRCPAASFSSRITWLDLSKNRLSQLDPALFSLAKLNVLVLVANELTSLPPEIADSQIQELYLSQNPISVLPKLPDTIHVLECCHCKFARFPEVFLPDRFLRVVNFSSNQLTKLPFFPAATEVNLALNKLDVIPPIPPQVRKLDLSHNRLHKFALAKQFVDVDLSHNSFKDIEIVDDDGCPELRSLKLSHNPKCQFVLSFPLFPKLTHIDFCATNCSHPFPVPDERLAELVVSTRQYYELDKNGCLRLYPTHVGYSESIGPRDTMEDALIFQESKRPGKFSFYGVVDGHAGDRTAHIVGHYLPTMFAQLGGKEVDDIVPAFEQLQGLLDKHKVVDGCAVAVAMIRGTELGVAHVGDVRILLVSTDGKTVPLTEDHKAINPREIQLIKERGSFVTGMRVEGICAVSRAMGDLSLRGVGHTPDVGKHTLQPDAWRLVIACDGVFDVLSNDEVGILVRDEPSVHAAAALVKNVALALHSCDNVSVVVVDLQKHVSP